MKIKVKKFRVIAKIAQKIACLTACFAFSASAASVAKVGSVGYTSLAEALGAAKDGGTCELLSDVTLTGDWTPIADFKGTLDGANFTITGLKASGSEYVGLIAILDGGTVKDVKFAEVEITGGTDAGTAVGRIINNGTVENVQVLSGTVSGTKRVGGVVGTIKAYGTVKNCANAASVSASTYNAGGIVGAAYYTVAEQEMFVTDCQNTAAVTSAGVGAGGIVGLSCAHVRGNTNTGTVTGTEVGGIVGEQKTYGSVTGNTNSGLVKNTGSGNYGSGGIIGWLRYHGTGESASYERSAVITVADNVNQGTVTGGNDAGGIVGVLYNSAVVTDNHNAAATLSGTTFAAGIVGNYQTTETPAASVPAENRLTFVGNTSETALESITAPCTDLLIYSNGNSILTDFSADEEGVWHIRTAAGLVAFGAEVNGGNTFEGKTVKLDADLDMSGVAFTPIGNVVSYPGITFAGVFDGQRHVIANLTATDSTPEWASAGLFGSIAGTVKNVKLTNVTITSTHYAGAIVGYTSESGSVIENCHVDGGTVTSTPELIDGKYDNGDKVGGIAGYLVGGDRVVDCSVKNLTMTAYRDVGGLVGCSTADLSGNKVEDTRVVQSNVNAYKDEVITTFGEVCGRTLGGSNTGATTSNVTLDGPVLISTKEALIAFAAAVNGGNTFAGKTVALTADIDLTGVSWTPIGNVVSYPGITFAGVFDGQNHVISNMTTSDATPNHASAGLFGSIAGTVKNVKLTNVTITSTHYAGAIVGFTSESGSVIENCHVDGGTVTSTPEFINGKYDNGDKVGGIAGYIASDNMVTGCTVENLTVKGYRDIGGAVGYVNSTATVTGTTVKNTTVVSDRSNGANYKNYTTDEACDAGSVVGEAASGATVSGNTAETGVRVVYVAFVAQIGETKYETLQAAAQAAQDGDTVVLLKDCADVGIISLPAKVTLDGNGHRVTGNSCVYINVAGGTIKNVVFEDIHNDDGKLSAIYAEGLSGTATITGCTFDNCDWDAIQMTPVAGAVISITGNVFDTDNTDGIQQQRYVHIESDPNVDFSATVTGNIMKGDTKQGTLEVYYFVDATKVHVSRNYIEDLADICILEKNGANVCEMAYPLYTGLTSEGAIDADTLTDAVAIIKSTYSAQAFQTLSEALIAAKTGDTIEILAGTWGADAIGTLDEPGKYTNAQSVRYKSLTIQPAEGAVVTFTSDLSLGYDDSSTANATMTVKNLNFDGASLKLSNYVQATVEGCTFRNGTSSTSGTLIVQDACCINHKTAGTYPASQVTIKNCTIDGSNDGASAIRIRNSGNVTITGNTITNSKFNGILMESNSSVDNTVAKSIVITGNTITEWNAANVAEGGRAMRLALGTLAAESTVSVANNVFRKATTGLDSPDFAKITGMGAATVSLDGNDWNDELRSTVSGNAAYYTVDTTSPVLLAGVVTTKHEPVAQVTVNGVTTKYTTFEDALVAANAATDATITLLDDVAYATNGSGLWNITSSMTLDGGGHALSGYGTRSGNKTTLAINNGGSAMVAVTLKNLTIRNDGTAGRPIETRGNISSLTLENCEVTATGSGNNQGITIGGNQSSAAKVVLKNTTVDAGRSGYPYISFNPATVEISGGTLSGYCGMYFKGESGSTGSQGTVVTATGTNFDCSNVHEEGSNDFGVFVLEDDGITINLMGCRVNSAVQGTARQAVVMTSGYAERSTQPCSISITGSETHVNGELMDNMWDKEPVLSVSGGTFSNAVLPEYCAAGFIPTENGDGTYGVTETFESVTVKSPVESEKTIDVRITKTLLNKVDGANLEEKVSNLNEQDENGNLAWVNLVAGIKPEKKVTMAAPQNDDAEVINVDLPAVDTALVGTDVTVRYEIRAEGSVAPVVSASAAENLVINLDGQAGISIYRTYVRLLQNGTEVACVASENALGVLKTVSKAKKTIIAVPWLSLTNGNAIAVADLVKTAGLTVGDKLHVYNKAERRYDVYELAANRTWTPQTIYKVRADSTVETVSSGTPETTTVARGNGVWLERQDTEKAIVSYGQVASIEVATTIDAGTAEKPTWNLLAVPTTTAVNVAATFGASEEDTLIVPTAGAPKICTVKDGAWWYEKSVPVTDASGNKLGVRVERKAVTELPAGTGFWYLNGGSDKTVNW